MHATPTGVDSAVALGQLFHLHEEQMPGWTLLQCDSLFVFLPDKVMAGYHGVTPFGSVCLPAQIEPPGHFRKWTLDGDGAAQYSFQLNFRDRFQSSRYCREKESMYRNPHLQPHPQLHPRPQPSLMLVPRSRSIPVISPSVSQPSASALP